MIDKDGKIRSYLFVSVSRQFRVSSNPIVQHKMLTHRPLTVPIDHFPIKWSKWNVSIGKLIDKGTLLGYYSSKGKQFQLTSEYTGELLSIAISEGEEWQISK